METYGNTFDINIIKVDAKERFLSKLEGVSDPEQKEKSSGMSLLKYLMKKPQKLKMQLSWHKEPFIQM